MTATGVTLTATEGTLLASVVVATFTTTDPGPPPASSYTATIDWGDGSATTVGTITGPVTGTYSVVGSHTYADEGTFTLTVHVDDAVDSTTATASGTANVGEGDFGTLLSATFNATVGVPYTGSVGSFTDPGNPLQVASDWSATIDWGDGTNTVGTVSGATGGPFTISGTHTYATPGSFTVKATFTDDPPSVLSATITSTADVAALPPTIAKAFGAISIPLSGSTSLSFTVTNPNATVALTGVAFSDTLPSGLIVSTPNGLTGSCGGGTIAAVQAGNAVSLSGASLPGDGSCTFSVSVTGAALGTQNNTTGSITSVESGTGATASATLIVAPAVPALGGLGLSGLALLLGVAGALILRRV